MSLRKPLIITISLLLSSGSLMAATVQENGKFLLLTKEEAAELQQKLSRVNGTERDALRQAEYERLKQKAEQAGYVVPALPATTSPVAQTPTSSPVPQAPPQPAAEPAAAVTETTGNVAPPREAEMSGHAEAAAPVSPAIEAPAPPVAANATAAEAPPPAPADATSPATTAAVPYGHDYQSIRHSHDELVKSMEARRDVLRAQMQKRREGMARQRVEMTKQRLGPAESQHLQEMAQRNKEHEAEIAARQKQHEEEMQAHMKEVEDRRKAMEARINSGINAIGRRPYARRPYYPGAAWAPRPGYAYPYGPYAYPHR